MPNRLWRAASQSRVVGKSFHSSAVWLFIWITVWYALGSDL